MNKIEVVFSWSIIWQKDLSRTPILSKKATGFYSVVKDFLLPIQGTSSNQNWGVWSFKLCAHLNGTFVKSTRKCRKPAPEQSKEQNKCNAVCCWIIWETQKVVVLSNNTPVHSNLKELRGWYILKTKPSNTNWPVASAGLSTAECSDLYTGKLNNFTTDSWLKGEPSVQDSAVYPHFMHEELFEDKIFCILDKEDKRLEKELKEVISWEQTSLNRWVLWSELF